MGKLKPSAPKGPSQSELDAQAKAQARADQNEENANKELSASARFAKNRRTGRRLLLAPGREDENAQLGGSSTATGGNF